ncbi:hypothetical protein BJV82DRAFT_489940, partial [Fennellomyces sp. T-0311]
VRSKLPPTTLQWIQNHVDNHLDWEKNQEHLRLTEEELQALEDGTGPLPEALRIKHHHVNHIIVNKQSKLARKQPIDKDSVISWFLELNEQGYQTLHHVMDSTFVISWISPRQAKLLQESNEICIDATHKTCKSIINCRDDVYLFSIIAKNAVTGRGYPLAFMITDKE